MARRVFLSVRHDVFLEWHGLAADYMMHSVKLAIISKSTPFEMGQNYITTEASVVAKSALQQKISN
jgi:hypothetical protein